jgi:Holliday junction resolvasome RuvABC ATP-dependent DNA helicase subunit
MRRNRTAVGNPSLHYSDLIGQEDNLSQLKRFTDFFKSTDSTTGHILLTGEQGMGQSTMSMTIANELDVGFQRTSATNLQIQGDLTAILTNLREKQILFIDNIHLLPSLLVDKLTTVIREWKLEITIGKGSVARRHVMEIRPFTLVATCPNKTSCPSELLSEFSLCMSLQPYSALELQSMAKTIAAKRGVGIDEGSAKMLAVNCDGRPGHLEQLFHRFARAINKEKISEEDIQAAFKAFGIPTKDNTAPNGTYDLQSLSGQDFEHLITALLFRMGFHAETTKTSGDGGIDIVAAFDKPIFGGRYLFQCKRFAPDNLVGAPTVRDFYGAVMAERAVKGIFVTTSDFTMQAREFAQKAGVELIDSTQLHKLLNENGLFNPQPE